MIAGTPRRLHPTARAICSRLAPLSYIRQASPESNASTDCAQFLDSCRSFGSGNEIQPAATALVMVFLVIT